MSNLEFSRLRVANVERCEEVFHPLWEWSPTDWACAMAGEAGEACNAVKKLRRHASGTNKGTDPQTEAAIVAGVGSELADLVIYADLLAARLGIDLGAEVVRKFNQVSRERKATVFL